MRLLSWRLAPTGVGRALFGLGALLAFASLATAQAAPPPAPGRAAAPRWGIDRFPARDLAPGTGATFRDLLQGEISAQNGVAFVDLAMECPDLGCTLDAGQRAGVRYVVHASIGRLGNKIVVTYAAGDVATRAALVSGTASVARIEELDVLARRIAHALVTGRKLDEGGELGEITEAEAAQPRRRSTRFALAFGPEMVVPTRGFAREELGAGGGVGLWLETPDFVLEPRIGYRTELAGGRNTYDHIPLELGVYYLLSHGDVAPLLGVGLGLHYLHEVRAVSHDVGRVLVSSSHDIIDESLFGVGGFVRAGVMLLRTYDVGVVAAFDYLITLADFEDRSDEQAFRLSVSLIIGGT